MAVVTNPSIDSKTRGIILHIVEQIKSQGVFDRFRRDCLEELDSKEPYRQLKQRVESHVATFLSKQAYSPSMPKNQLRASLRTNISQSEVLSKGVDRLLEQVLKEKSASFYSEIEGLVHDYLYSIGHYSRKQQRAGAESTRLQLSNTSSSTAAEGEKNISTKLSDKEIDDFIKEETTRFLEATAEEKMKERMVKMTHGMASSIEESIPASEDVTEVDADVVDKEENEKNVESNTTEVSNLSVVETTSEPVDDIPTTSQDVVKQADQSLVEVTVELPSENVMEIEKISEEKTDSSKEEKIGNETENIDNKAISKEVTDKEVIKDVQYKISAKMVEELSVSPIPSPTLKAEPMSTDDGTDDNGDFEIHTTLISKENLSKEETKAKVSDHDIELSDSDDITVSSVHTSDLSSLEDSLSDIEFEDFKAMSKRSEVTKVSTTTDASDALAVSSREYNDTTISEANQEAAMQNSYSGNMKPDDPRNESSQISSEIENDSSDAEVLASSSTEGQKDIIPQRRSARVASKDKFKSEESDELPNVAIKEPVRVTNSEESMRRVRRKRREIKEKKRESVDSMEDETSNEQPRRRDQRITSESNESEDIKQSKRSRRTIRPTRCYSPSENY